MAERILPFSEDMHQLLGDALSALGIEAEEKKMFGHHTMFLNGYMFAGGNVRGIFLNIGRDEVDRLLQENNQLFPFAPGGRAMRDYIQLGLPIAEDPSELKAWVKRSANYLTSLPPKVKKPKKKKA